MDNFKEYFLKNISDHNISDYSDIDEFKKLAKSKSFNTRDYISSVCEEVSVGFNDSLNLCDNLPASYQIDFINEPIVAGLKALTSKINLFQLGTLINTGLVQYRDRELKPNKKIDVSIVYSNIPNIIPYNKITNYIVINNFTGYEEFEYEEQLDILSNFLGEVIITSPVSFFIEKDNKLFRNVLVEQSTWRIIRDRQLIDTEQQIESIVNSYK
jgi:hypothetical protein